jgi:hypothetical protein
MTVHKGRSKAQKWHTSGIACLTGQKKAEQSASVAQRHSMSTPGGKRRGKDIFASSASAAELISRLTETVESQEAELEIVKLELKFKDLALESLKAKFDSSQEQLDRLIKTLHVE